MPPASTTMCGISSIRLRSGPRSRASRPGCGATPRCAISSTGCASTMARRRPASASPFTASISTASMIRSGRCSIISTRSIRNRAEVARERYGCLTPWQRDPATYGHAALTGSYPTCETDVVAHARRPPGEAPGLCRARRRAVPRRRAECRVWSPMPSAITGIMYYGSRASWNLRDTPHVRDPEDAAGASRRRQQGGRLGAQFACRQCGRDRDGGARRVQYRPALPRRNSATTPT